MPRLRLEEIRDLAFHALTKSRTSEANAGPVAQSLAAAEADGIPSHGLLRLPTYCEHARVGKVDGMAEPAWRQAGPAAIVVDAMNGFAHPAIEIALQRLVRAAREQAVAAVAVCRSYNSGVMGHHVELLAEAGLVALAFANAPAVIAPWGGRKPVFGTNPIAFAAPRAKGPPLVVDQASSVVARGQVLLHAQRGEPIPSGWAMDAQGQPTTDPRAVLDGGSMAPAGSYKGVSIALIVEVFAAALAGPLYSFEAGSLTIDDGKPAGVGQFFVALDPARFAGAGFADRIDALCEAMLRDPNVRLPGARRYAVREAARIGGVEIDEKLHGWVKALAQ